MPKFAANLSMLFTELPFMERFAAAARAGFRGVEYAAPYDYPSRDIAAELDRNRLRQVLFNLPSGDWARGERGIACHPDRVAEFRAGVDEAIAYAGVLGNDRVNCLAGIAPDGVPATELRRTLVDNLRYAAGNLQRAGVLLLVEPINRFDIPGFVLTGSAEAIDLIDEVGSENLKLQYDIYHMQRMEGELAASIERLLPRIGHIQIADNPGRHEPGTGEINFAFLHALIDRLGYSGWIGAEYRPRSSTADGLGWLAPAAA
jgi:hydroxypyruvate isomerase